MSELYPWSKKNACSQYIIDMYTHAETAFSYLTSVFMVQDSLLLQTISILPAVYLLTRFDHI